MHATPRRAAAYTHIRRTHTEMTRHARAQGTHALGGISGAGHAQTPSHLTCRINSGRDGGTTPSTPCRHQSSTPQPEHTPLLFTFVMPQTVHVQVRPSVLAAPAAPEAALAFEGSMASTAGWGPADQCAAGRGLEGVMMSCSRCVQRERATSEGWEFRGADGSAPHM
jgi:hypothetical protein